MSEAYIGEIRLVGMNFAPVDWLMCDGSLQSIANYETLYNLIGTTYGGDGQTTFGLPDLRGRVPIHQGAGPGLSTYVPGMMAGMQQVTLTVNNLPPHTHPLACNNTQGGQSVPTGNYFAGNQQSVYASPGTGAAYVAMASVVGPAGQSQPHDNMQPYQAVNYIICTAGYYPSPA